ncbi:MAG: hypothetical protein AAGA60_29605 [Cyanobacteria bacterium P01_E01_bin.42]
MKNTWIVTTGNSDIWLNSTEHWDEACDRANFTIDKRPNQPNSRNSNNKKDSKLYFLVSRCLGLMYSNYPEAFQDLTFPLWDLFLKYFEDNNITIHRMIVLLTDQEKIFPKQDKDNFEHAFWKDTVKCQPLFEQYLQNHNWSKDIKLDFRILTLTKTSKGLDYWDIAILNEL